MTSTSPAPGPNPRDLFLEALEHPASQRVAFLDGACRGDAALRAAVDELLANHREDSFLEDPAVAAPTVITPPSEQPGERIGRYKLLQEIGEGGFGTVWMAEQMEPVTRRVALKIIKLGMDTKEVIARFEAERQALAMMDHPNISKVLDAGATDQGRPFFVMELVKGMPITRYCDDAGLGTRDRLTLFGDVCSAINHAHQKGVIHRDIKPSNVMVTLHGDKPVVKVIDFGIAKATQGKLTDKTLFTRFEQFIGTPVYMSPEQASLSGLDVDTRSDIYGLGILLYELLTGKPPFDAKSLASAGYEEMRRIIREVEPPKPSTRLKERLTASTADHQAGKSKIQNPNSEFEPDLDWIVMKAIEKDRSRRYETASAFAQDIQRFLADEPVSATPPSASYRFGKFARRNKGALRVATGIAAVLVAATIVSSSQAVRATKAEKLASYRLAQVAAERDAKERARMDAEGVATFLSEVFQSPDPNRDGRTIKVAELLDTAAQKLDTDLANQPARRARLQVTLSNTYHALGLYSEAIVLEEKVRDYFMASAGPGHPDTLDAMNNLAASYQKAGRRDQALTLQKEVLARRQVIFGAEHPETLAALNNLAAFCADAGRQDEALNMWEQVLTLRRKVLGPGHPDTLGAMNNLATCYFDSGHRDQALAMREAVLPLMRKALGPEHPNTLGAMSNLATSYHDAGRRDEALILREQVLELRRKVLGPEHADTLMAMHHLANSYDEAARRNEALALREQVLSLRRKVLGPEHADTLGAMNNLASSYSDVGQLENSIPLQTDMVPLMRKVLGPEHRDTLGAMTNLANSYDAASRHVEALALREEVLKVSRKVLGPDHHDTVMAMHNLANSYEEAGRLTEALTMREQVLTLRRTLSGAENPDTLRAMNNLANSYEDAGRRVEAITLREQVLTLRRKQLGPEHPSTLGAMNNLIISYRANGELSKADAMETKMTALKEKVQRPATTKEEPR